MNKKFVNARWLLRGLTSKVDYKRDMYIWFSKVSAKMAFEALKQRVNPLDVSHYQDIVPWQTLHTQGVRFAFAKATEARGAVSAAFASKSTQRMATHVSEGPTAQSYNTASVDSVDAVPYVSALPGGS